MKTPHQTSLRWTFHIDGSSSIDGSRAGLVPIPLDDDEPLRYAQVLTFKATNNASEYEALITSLQIAKMDRRHLYEV